MLKKKLTILMINDHFSFGGGGDAAFRLEKSVYEQAGHQVYTFSKSVNVELDRQKNDKVYKELNSRYLRKAAKFTFEYGVYKSLKGYIKEIKPDVIKVHLISKYPTSVYSALLGVECPVIQVLHGPNLFCVTSWGCLKKNSQDCEMGIGFKCWSRGCASLSTVLPYLVTNTVLKHLVQRSVDLFVCPSHHLRASAESLGYIPAEYLPLSIDPSFADTEPADFSGVPTVLYVGALVKQKGVDILLKSFGLVLQKIPNARMLFAGRGLMEPELKRMAQEMGISDQVGFLGFVSREEIVALYRVAHVLAVPSVWKEQFGLVGPEALSCGVPCVGSSVGGIPEWLFDGQWGWLVQPRDVNGLAEKLTSILSDADLRNSFGKKGREFVLKDFGVDRYKTNLLKHIAQVITQ